VEAKACHQSSSPLHFDRPGHTPAKV
jgi:hypothetical protein